MCVCTVTQQSEPTFRRIALELSRSDRVWTIQDDGITVGKVEDNVVVPRAQFEVGDGIGNPVDIAADDTYLYVATGGVWQIPLEGDYQLYGQSDPHRIFTGAVPENIWLDGTKIYWLRKSGGFASPVDLYVYDIGTDTETLVVASVAGQDDSTDLTVGPDGLVWVTVTDAPEYLTDRIDRYTTTGTLVDTITRVAPGVAVDLVPFNGAVYLATFASIIRFETDGEECVIEFPTWTTFDGAQHTAPPDISFNIRGLASNDDRLALSEGTEA